MALVGHDGIPKVLVRLDRIQEKGIDSGIGEARLQLPGENLQDKGLVVRESKDGRSGSIAGGVDKKQCASSAIAKLVHQQETSGLVFWKAQGQLEKIVYGVSRFSRFRCRLQAVTI